MRTTDVINMNAPREAYLAPQVEVIEMETENDMMIVGSPGALDNGDPDMDSGAAKAPSSLWD